MMILRERDMPWAVLSVCLSLLVTAALGFEFGAASVVERNRAAFDVVVENPTAINSGCVVFADMETLRRTIAQGIRIDDCVIVERGDSEVSGTTMLAPLGVP